MFRMCVSLSEHIAHCPERLSYVFHTILNSIEGDTLVSNNSSRVFRAHGTRPYPALESHTSL